jgi:hypothetical protein
MFPAYSLYLMPAGIKEQLNVEKMSNIGYNYL